MITIKAFSSLTTKETNTRTNRERSKTALPVNELSQSKHLCNPRRARAVCCRPGPCAGPRVNESDRHTSQTLMAATALRPSTPRLLVWLHEHLCLRGVCVCVSVCLPAYLPTYLLTRGLRTLTPCWWKCRTVHSLWKTV